MLDASQSVPHLGVDVQALGIDLLACTGHKMLGPTGIGVLWGRYDLLESLPPFLGGGEMIEEVTLAGSTYALPPARFEAGTPPIAQAVALGTAVDYLSGLGMDAVAEHEHRLTSYLLEGLGLGRRAADHRARPRAATAVESCPSPWAGCIRTTSGQVLDEQGIAVRVGHHCARPVCLRYGVPATTRASLHLYSTTGEIDALVTGLEDVKRFFG